MPFTDELFQYINKDVFLETGTYQGDTIYNIANNNNICVPEKIISLELSDVFYENCVKRFIDDSRIKIHKANSKYDLYNIIKDIDSPITFWLDSHWSGVQDIGCDNISTCPIIEELEQIKQHTIKTHTIMIDDIRLMNNSNDRIHGFPVTLSEIISKVNEINPNYKIKFYDDYNSKNDVLVACIEEPLYCIHHYLTYCKTNPKPPGFADFIRGTIALYYFSKKYGYELLLDIKHPMFQYLYYQRFETGHPIGVSLQTLSSHTSTPEFSTQASSSTPPLLQNDGDIQPSEDSNVPFEFFKGLKENIQFIKVPSSKKVIELLPPLDYLYIYNNLNEIFQKKESFSVMTNSFYNYDNGDNNWGDLTVRNWGEITDDCIDFLKNILIPSSELENKLNYVLKSVYELKENENFQVIHLRL